MTYSTEISNLNQALENNDKTDILDKLIIFKNERSKGKRYFDSFFPVFLGAGSIPPTLSPILSGVLSASKNLLTGENSITIYAGISAIITNSSLSWLYAKSVLQKILAPYLCKKIGLEAKKQSSYQKIFLLLGAAFMTLIFCSITLLGDYSSPELKWSLIALTLSTTFIMKIYAFDNFQKIYQRYRVENESEIIASQIHNLITETVEALNTTESFLLKNKVNHSFSNLIFNSQMIEIRNKNRKAKRVKNLPNFLKPISFFLTAPSMLAYFSGVETGNSTIIKSRAFAILIALFPIESFHLLVSIQSLEVVKKISQCFCKVWNDDSQRNLIEKILIHLRSYSMSLRPKKSLALSVLFYSFVIFSYATTLALSENAIESYPFLDHSGLRDFFKTLNSVVAIIFNAFPAPEVLDTFFNFYVSLTGTAEEKERIEKLAALQELSLLFSCSTPESVIKKFSEILPKNTEGPIDQESLTKAQKNVLRKLVPPSKTGEIEEQPLVESGEGADKQELGKVITIINNVLQATEENLTITEGSAPTPPSQQTSTSTNFSVLLSKISNLWSSYYRKDGEEEQPLLNNSA